MARAAWGQNCPLEAALGSLRAEAPGASSGVLSWKSLLLRQDRGRGRRDRLQSPQTAPGDGGCMAWGWSYLAESYL